ncbi:MAG: hypothetical protein ACYTEG_09035 [Planctomycetota bacterium]|jgi:hypothetical protein
MRNSIAVAFLLVPTLLLSLAGPAAAQEEELVPYSLVEAQDLLANFKALYNKKKTPEEDAVNALTGLVDAYRYFKSKGEEATKDEKKMMASIVKMVSKGLSARNRPRVNVMCARALGTMADTGGAKALLKWMDKTVLDAKAPNSGWVEYGFRSMAWIGATDGATLDFVLTYATGKHSDTNVQAQALMACYEWRMLPGKDRKEFFKKIQQSLGGTHSLMRGNDAKKRGNAEQKYNTIKDNGLKALHLLSGEEKAFADPEAAFKWWKDAKKRKWEDYENLKLKPKKVEESKEEKPAEKPSE